MTVPTQTAPRRKRNGGRDGSKAQRLAAVHARGDRLCLVLATPRPDGSIQISESHVFERTEADQVTRLLARHKVDRLIGVVPSAQSIARIAPAPASAGADEHAVAGALDLLAETEVGAIAPPHRRSAGIVSPAGPGGTTIALAQAWTDSPQRANTAADLEPHLWITVPAALATLAQSLGGVTIITDADQEGGAATIVASNGARTVARVARLDNADAETWRVEFAHACNEVTGSIGLEGGIGVPVNSGTGVSPVSAIKSVRLGPEAGGTDWLRDFGPCAGALLAATSSDPALRALATLHRRPPELEMSPLLRLATWLSEPKRAAPVAAACVLVALLVPVAAAYGRWWMLKEQAGGRAALSERLQEARDAAEFHKLLREERWPMAKLLADVASSAPEGVQLEVLDLSRSGGLSLRGTAESTNLITQFRENLAQTRVFAAIEVPTRAESASNVEFQLNARVENPLFSQVVVDDFGKRTLFQRIYGDEAVPSHAPSPAAAGDQGDDTPRSSRTAARSSRRPEQGGGEPSPAVSRREAAAPIEIPPPLTDEQLAAMDAAAATAEMTKRTEALALPDLDEATRQRLKEEQERAKRRMFQAIGEQRQ